MRVFVYGTLKKDYGNNRCLRGAAYIRTDRIKNFMLKDNGFPAAMPEEGSMIEGEVWDIGNVNESPEARRILAQCDMLEGYDPQAKNNYFYKREVVETLTGETVHMYVGQPESFDRNPDWPHTLEGDTKVYVWDRN